MPTPDLVYMHKLSLHLLALSQFIKYLRLTTDDLSYICYSFCDAVRIYKDKKRKTNNKAPSICSSLEILGLFGNVHTHSDIIIPLWNLSIIDEVRLACN